MGVGEFLALRPVLPPHRGQRHARPSVGSEDDAVAMNAGSQLHAAPSLAAADWLVNESGSRVGALGMPGSVVVELSGSAAARCTSSGSRPD